MATWNGTPKKFTLERYDPKDNYYGGGWVEVEMDWSYNTTSDSLCIQEHHEYCPDKNDEQNITRYGKEDAKALLYMLFQWCIRYEGREETFDLLADIIEED